MDVAIVSTLCVVALGLAGWITVRGRSLVFERVPWMSGAEAAPASEVVTRFLRTVCIGVAAGGLAGVLVGGFGARLMMRIMAATSGDLAQGLVTQADERVGRISVGGTLAILLFVGLFFGIAGGLVFVLVRRWLPRRAWLAGALFGLIGLMAVAPGDPLDPHNRDFLILRPVGLAVALIAALFVAGGVTMAVLAARLDRSYPVLDRPRAVLAYAPLVVLAVPFLLVPAVVLLLAALAAQTSGAIRRGWRNRWVDRGGQVAVGVAGVLFAFPFISAVADILG
jgi:hypothetical protein